MTLPAHIQKALTQAGGKRLNGEPNYKFMWSGDFTYLISNGSGYEPFRVVSDDCWLLVKYELPEFWGTKEEWELNNWELGRSVDEKNGVTLLEPLYTAGPYPVQGRYRNIMRIKRNRKLTDGVTVLENCAPTLQWVADVFPGVRDFLELSPQEKSKVIADRESGEKASLLKELMSARKDYKGSASVKEVKAKEEAIERFLGNRKRVEAAIQLTKG